MHSQRKEVGKRSHRLGWSTQHKTESVYNPDFFHYNGVIEKDFSRGLHTELLYAIIPTLFTHFLVFCYPYILLLLVVLQGTHNDTTLVCRVQHSKQLDQELAAANLKARLLLPSLSSLGMILGILCTYFQAIRQLQSTFPASAQKYYHQLYQGIK